MSLKGQIETFTGAGGRRFSRMLDDPRKGNLLRALSAPPGDLRLKDLSDMTTKQKLDNMYKANLLSPDSGLNGGETNPAFDNISIASTTTANQKTTIISFVIDEDEATDESSNKAKNIKEHKSDAVTVLLSVLYAIVISLVGTIYPISEALRGEWLNDHVVSLFLVYLFTVSSVFLIYLQVEIYRNDKHSRKKKKATKDGLSSTNDSPTDKDEDKGSGSSPNMLVYRRRKSALSMIADEEEQSHTEEVSPVGNIPDVRIEGPSIESPGLERPSIEGPSVESPGLERPRISRPSRGSSRPSMSDDNSVLSEEIYEELSFQTQTASLSHEAASIYLRLGALLFGIGNLVLVSLELEFHYGRTDLADCPDLPKIYPAIFQMIFLTVQTFFILKHTQVKIKKRQGLARFGLMHVLATNLCVWMRVLVREVQEGVDGKHYFSTGRAYNMDISVHGATHAETSNITSCSKNNDLLDQASPFLFPCVLEYSLIALAVMAGMFQSLYIKVSQNVIEMIQKKLRQRNSRDENMVTSSSEKHNEEHVSMFDKSHKGLYLGILVLTGTVISIILFFYRLNSLDDSLTAMSIFHITDICLHTTLIIAVIFGQLRIYKLHFTLSRNNTIDDRLLILSFAGLFLFAGFIVISSIASLVYLEKLSNDEIFQSWCALTAAILNIVQALLQTIFVIDGLQRCSIKVEDQRKKPGRGIITFLLITNLAVWIFKTFQVKEAGLSTQAAYFGDTPWAIILNINLPLMLFFRFHSSVCMADIWISAYQDEHNEMGFQVLN